jgi:DNA polymerase-3 subunit delta
LKLPFTQLEHHLGKTLAPVYLIAGDEPLQKMEAADAIRKVAQAQGFSERQVIHVEAGFDWSMLEGEAAAMSLFAEKKIIDLRLPTGKPGRDGSKAIVHYMKQPPEDNLLLIQSGKLDRSSTTTAWFKAIDKVGVVMQIWDLKPAETMRLVGDRLGLAGFQADREAVKLLTERVEGNLLAAVQEIEKLRLIREPGPLSPEDVIAAVADSARYDPFELADAALMGDARRSLKILRGLQGEGIHPNVVLWALTRDIRVLADYASLQAHGHSPQTALQGVWKNRQSLLHRAVRRLDAPGWAQLLRHCARVDRIAKGIGQGNIWDELLQLTLAFAGQPVLEEIDECIT